MEQKKKYEVVCGFRGKKTPVKWVFEAANDNAAEDKVRLLEEKRNATVISTNFERKTEVAS